MAPVIKDALRVFERVKSIPREYRKLVCYLTGHLPTVHCLRENNGILYPYGMQCPRCKDVWLDMEEIKLKNRELERNAEIARRREDAEIAQRAATPVQHETNKHPVMEG